MTSFRELIIARLYTVQLATNNTEKNPIKPTPRLHNCHHHAQQLPMLRTLALLLRTQKTLTTSPPYAFPPIVTHRYSKTRLKTEHYALSTHEASSVLPIMPPAAVSVPPRRLFAR